MTPKDLTQLVEHAVRQEWSDFSEAHPRLAQVLSEPLLLSAAQESLRDSEPYRKAIENAMLAEATLASVQEVVKTHVRQWFSRLV